MARTAGPVPAMLYAKAAITVLLAGIVLTNGGVLFALLLVVGAAAMVATGKAVKSRWG